ncbi:MAG: EF-hand domain-containing protein [Chthoniobacter sp.]|uniref:EF-hand domain-containing protein n=1 Tax=Chthoniobacter sp. TaxID=2510640 RepID=UPI0032A51FAB
MKAPLALALLVCLLGSISLADEGSTNKRAEQLFKKLDTNGDGGISLEEYGASMFGGYVSPKQVAKIFKQKDQDGDGKLSLAELMADGKKKDGKKSKMN